MCLCPICESAGHAEFFEKDGRVLLICRNCRHIWWRDLPIASELSDYYHHQYTQLRAQEIVQEQVREYYRAHLFELVNLIHRRAEETTLLDYGCSIPVLASEAVRLSFKRVLGVDYADEAKRSGRIQGVEVISPSELGSVPDQSFDIVRLSHVIEHSLDPMTLLRELLPKVRPGGLVYITQPSFPVFRPERSAHDLLDTVYPEHLHFFSALSMIEMLSRLNLRVATFFSHMNADKVMAKYGPQVDLDYARERLSDYASMGDALFPEQANYPYYAGENSKVFAFVKL